MITSYNNQSPYSATAQVTTYINYLDVWTPPALTTSSDDAVITLPSKYNNRPDLLSYDYYGTPRLWWVFSVYNGNSIKDPIYDLVTGMQIIIPSKNSLVGLT